MPSRPANGVGFASISPARPLTARARDYDECVSPPALARGRSRPRQRVRRDDASAESDTSSQRYRVFPPAPTSADPEASRRHPCGRVIDVHQLVFNDHCISRKVSSPPLGKSEKRSRRRGVSRDPYVYLNTHTTMYEIPIAIRSRGTFFRARDISRPVARWPFLWFSTCARHVFCRSSTVSVTRAIVRRGGRRTTDAPTTSRETSTPRRTRGRDAAVGDDDARDGAARER